MCSWESGQDMMLRWGWDQQFGGDRSSRIIRAPEHQAAMAHAAGVMAQFASVLKLPKGEAAFWAGVKERHVNLTRSLFNKDAHWFCDFNSQDKVWQSGCRDDGPPSGNSGAGKQTYQLAPLFFHSDALGVDLTGGIDLAPLVETVTNPTKFGSDPPGSLVFTSYCTQTPIDPRCVSDIWAPHPWMIIAAADNANFTKAASDTTAKLADRVFGKLDARVRHHFPAVPSHFLRSASQGSPYPGASYECLSIGT